MAFTGNEDHSITLAEASKLTKNYRQTAGTGAILGGFFGKTALSKILSQQGCVGIRIYYAREDDGGHQFVLVGADANEKDMENGELAERSLLCPPHCGPLGSLNS